MPTNEHLAWLILGAVAVLSAQVIGDFVYRFLKWRSERRREQS